MDRIFNQEDIWCININDDTQPFTQQILNGEKTIETRPTRMANIYSNINGKRIGCYRTGKNKRGKLLFFADVVEEKMYKNDDDFLSDSNEHKVSADSKYFKSNRLGYRLANVSAATKEDRMELKNNWKNVTNFTISPKHFVRKSTLMEGKYGQYYGNTDVVNINGKQIDETSVYSHVFVDFSDNPKMMKMKECAFSNGIWIDDMPKGLHKDLYAKKLFNKSGCDKLSKDEKSIIDSLRFVSATDRRYKNVEGRFWEEHGKTIVVFPQDNPVTDKNKEICKKIARKRAIPEEKVFISTIDGDLEPITRSTYSCEAERRFRMGMDESRKILRSEILRCLKEDTKHNNVSVPDAVYFKGEYFDFRDAPSSFPFILTPKAMIYGDKNDKNHYSAVLKYYLTHTKKIFDIPRNMDGSLVWGEVENYTEESAFKELWNSQIIRGRVFKFKDSYFDACVISTYDDGYTEANINRIINILVGDDKIDEYGEIIVKRSYNVIYYSNDYCHDNDYNTNRHNVRFLNFRNIKNKPQIEFLPLNETLENYDFGKEFSVFIRWVEESFKTFNQGFLTIEELTQEIEHHFKQTLLVSEFLNYDVDMKKFNTCKNIINVYIKQNIK